MKILKPGKIKGFPATLVCEECDCEFEVQKHEMRNVFTEEGREEFFICPTCGSTVDAPGWVQPFNDDPQEKE